MTNLAPCLKSMYSPYPYQISYPGQNRSHSRLTLSDPSYTLRPRSHSHAHIPHLHSQTPFLHPLTPLTFSYPSHTPAHIPLLYSCSYTPLTHRTASLTVKSSVWLTQEGTLPHWPSLIISPPILDTTLGCSRLQRARPARTLCDLPNRTILTHGALWDTMLNLIDTINIKSRSTQPLKRHSTKPLQTHHVL